MFRLCRACALFRLAGCAAFALALAGCATALDGASQPPAAFTTAMLGAGNQPDRAGASRRLSSAEQDMIVARAIAAHEMRNP